MTTVRLTESLPLVTGPAAAVTEVQERMDLMNDRVEQFSDKLTEAVSDLQSVTVEDTAFAQPDVDFTPVAPALQPLPAPLDDSITVGLDEAAPVQPDFTPNVPAVPTSNWPTAPIIDSVNIPAPPTFQDVEAPARPAIATDLSVPDAPDLVLPTMEALSAINVPNFVAPVLPTFDEAAPMFDQALPSTSLNFAEPTYASENFDEILATLRTMRLGGSGLPPAVETAIFERGRAREDRAAAKAVAEVFDNWAGRGFTAPPGALSAQVAAVREQSQLTVATLSRDVLINATQIQVENLRYALTQGLAAEQILVNIFSNAAQRAFDAARYAVESGLALYNAAANVFNALVQAHQTKAQVFKIRLDAELAALEVQRLELEAAKVKGELNEQMVRQFTALVQATLARVELYKGQIAGVQAKAEVAKITVDTYRADVQAFAETIGAQKVRFDAYKSQVEGESERARVGQARAGVFATLVQAERSKLESWRDQAQVEFSVVDAKAKGFAAAVDAYRARTGVVAQKISAQAELKRTAIQATSVQNSAVIETNRAAISLGELQHQSNVLKVNSAIKLYEVNLTKIMQAKDLQARSFQAIGQYYATLAGGAMAAQHVSASISAGSSESNSVSRSESLSNSLSESV